MAMLEAIQRVLEEAAEPLAVTDIAARANCDIRECDAVLWQNPGHFVWQPGQKWTVATAKHRATDNERVDAPDARPNMMSAAEPKELRAFTMSSGLKVAVNRRPLDSDAFFTVRSAGNTLTVTLNSMHELYAELPVPFEAEGEEGFKELCETLLTAWALYEDGLPGGSVKRATEDARLLWGRRAVEVLREREA
ncbi:hypothetical protein AU196_22470 [Mycobacterium sp. IS-1742]|uniref:hypothetical protein n=1 Tax=Mycobacterium sp. IS-1742 TaxID=1772285 RepID=UPI00073FC62E|nr:hypothetical protein [Mycobacterium sp. IS-1742]KUI25579.1 hypothetical protein AU196_22470 [Mycobacterium sp. IS-1742]